MKQQPSVTRVPSQEGAEGKTLLPALEAQDKNVRHTNYLTRQSEFVKRPFLQPFRITSLIKLNQQVPVNRTKQFSSNGVFKCS